MIDARAGYFSVSRLVRDSAVRLPVWKTLFGSWLLWRASTADSPLLALDLDSAALRELGARPDCAEGVQAFLDRRPPQFTSKVSTDMPAVYRWWERNADER